MAASLILRVAALSGVIGETLAALREGVSSVTPDIPVDVSGSSAVESASYNVIDFELTVQYRNRKRKRYVFPMTISQVLAFVGNASKGRFLSRLKGRLI